MHLVVDAMGVSMADVGKMSGLDEFIQQVIIVAVSGDKILVIADWDFGSKGLEGYICVAGGSREFIL